MRYQADMIW